jgi:hypothetical protein
MCFSLLRAASLALLISFSAYSQLAKDSWSLGFGIKYPRLMSISSLSTGHWSGIGNIGGYAALQRNVSEHLALRLQASYNYMETEKGNSTQSIVLVAADFDMLYYFIPCEVITRCARRC